MRARKHVALLIETSTSWGADLIRGIMTYAREQTNWMIHLEPRGKYEVVAPPGGWTGQGIIARVTTPELAEYIGALGLAAVNVSWYRYNSSSTRLAHCTTDVHRAGEMCAQYFRERGFRHFAYCGAVHRPHYDDELERAFRAALTRQGRACRVFASKRLWHKSSWQMEYDELQHWLAELPKPIGVLAFDSVRGRQITEVCRGEGIAVPEQIAVLAGEHDQLCSELSIPPLSTLDIAPKRVGYRAAELLNQMFQRGELLQREPERVLPGGITTRQSTDTLAIEDADVARAIRFIHEHAASSIQVKDVLREVPISRRALEQKFKTLLGRTPAVEIRRRRIELVSRLLDETTLPLSAIALKTGFRHAEVLIRVFQRETGLTPAVYRNQKRHKVTDRKLRVDQV